MGDLIPDAQVKGLALSSFIALICKSDSAIISPVSFKFLFMMQRYIVFLNERTVTICRDVVSESVTNGIIFPFTDDASLVKIYNEFCTDSQQRNLLILAKENFTEAKSAFDRMFTLVKAAGGIVRNQETELLFIKRMGTWDLPKGKLHDNEPVEYGAIREVTEETGLTGITITKQLPSTFHIYTDRKGREILKETVWFEMMCHADQNLVPQLEEDITEVKWFGRNELNVPLANTYASLQHLLSDYLQP